MAIKYSSNIPSASKVIVAISMRKDPLAGTRLQSLITDLKARECEATVLIADTLQQYNSSYEKGKADGDRYIAENKAILEKVTCLRWEELKEKTADYEAMKKLVEDESKENSPFYNKQIRTAKRCFSTKNIDNSLKYQQEEYGLLLALRNYDYLIYDKTISDGMAFLYTQEPFKKIKKPIYIHANIPYSQLKQIEFFANPEKSQVTLPLAGKMVYDATMTFLASGQVSPESKKLFIEQMEILLKMQSEVLEVPEAESKSNLPVISNNNNAYH
jgi:hypothetical protein